MKACNMICFSFVGMVVCYIYNDCILYFIGKAAPTGHSAPRAAAPPPADTDTGGRKRTLRNKKRINKTNKNNKNNKN